jgi:hypothetical protein
MYADYKHENVIDVNEDIRNPCEKPWRVDSCKRSDGVAKRKMIANKKILKNVSVRDDS